MALGGGVEPSLSKEMASLLWCERLHRRRLVQQLLCFHSSSVALDIQFLSNVFYVRPFAYAADDVFADLFPLFVVTRTAKGLVPMRLTLSPPVKSSPFAPANTIAIYLWLPSMPSLGVASAKHR